MNTLDHLYLLVIVMVIHSCKPLQQVTGKPSQSLPSAFKGRSDSATSANIHWKQYFADQYLVSLIDSALNNNQHILIASQRVQAAQSDVLLSKGSLKPNVDVGFSSSLRRFGLYTMDGAGNVTTDISPGKIVPTHLPDYFVGLQTSWEADLWGKLRNQKKASAARVMSSVEGRNLIITTIISEIANHYYALLSFDHAIRIIDESIALQQNALEMVRVQKEAAAANELAVEQFEVQLLSLQSLRLATEQQIMETESGINHLAGRFPQAVDRDSSMFMKMLPRDLQSGVPSALLHNRPDIRQAELELIASKADLQSAKAAFYPTVNINGSIGWQAFQTGLLFTTPQSLAYGIFSSLSAPLINRAAIKAAFLRANAFQLETLYNYQQSILNAFMEVHNEMQRINNLRQDFDVKSKKVDKLYSSVKTSSALYRSGRANYLEVLFTQQNALQSRLEQVETRRELWISAVNLYKALGGGWK